MPTPEFRPDDLAAFRRRIERIEKLLADQQRRAPLRSSSISDDDGNVIVRFNENGLQFLDPDTGVVIARLDGTGLDLYQKDSTPRFFGGDFGEEGGGTFDGLVWYDGNGRSMIMSRDDKAGLVKPDIPAVFRKPNDFIPVTSASYVVTAEWDTRRTYHDSLYVDVGVGSDPATVGQIRLREKFSGATTNAVTTTAETAQTARFLWLHGRAPGDDPGDTIGVVVEARRTSGTGNLNVYQPRRAIQTSSALIAAASDGNPSIF